MVYFKIRFPREKSGTNKLLIYRVYQKKGNPTLACHCMCVNYWVYERNFCMVRKIRTQLLNDMFSVSF